jgi:hypothetical protein
MLSLAVLAALSCGGNTRSPWSPAGMPGLVALPNSAIVYHSGGRLVGLTPAGAPAWEVTLPGGVTVIARVAVAPNSTLYARSRNALHAIDYKGAVLWSTTLPEPPPGIDREALAPAALANSAAVIFDPPSRLRAFDLDGKERWAADLEGGEPRGGLVVSRNGQLVVATARGLYAFSGDGALAWKYAPTGPAS